MITALIEPSAGKVLLDGRDIREDLIAFKRRLGYVPEEAILYSYLTGLEYLQLMGCLRGIPTSHRAEGQRSAASSSRCTRTGTRRFPPTRKA